MRRLLGLGALRAASPSLGALSAPVGSLFYDTFTGAASTALTSHTPENGGLWYAGNGNNAILDGSGYAIPAVLKAPV
jgi:hypothetical protein